LVSAFFGHHLISSKSYRQAILFGITALQRQIPKDLAEVAGKTVYSEYLVSLTPESSFDGTISENLMIGHEEGNLDYKP